MFSSQGKIIYYPIQGTVIENGIEVKKYPTWACKVIVSDSISDYYRYWVNRELGIKLQKQFFGAHITLCKYDEPTNKSAWGKYEGNLINFEYSIDIDIGPKTVFWLPVKSPEMEEIRIELGLRPLPRYPFHISIGNRKGEKNNYGLNF